MLTGKGEVKAHDISGETSRTYTVYGLEGGTLATIVINSPETLYCGIGHFFHRVFNGVHVMLCPAPGVVRDHEGDVIGYCVVSWVPENPSEPCQF
jgi:hypothetical protein